MNARRNPRSYHDRQAARARARNRPALLCLAAALAPAAGLLFWAATWPLANCNPATSPTAFAFAVCALLLGATGASLAAAACIWEARA